MKRKMMLAERIMFVDPQTPFNVVFPVKIRGELSESQLRHALDRIQSKHPMLRCAVRTYDGVPYMELQDDPGPIPLRVAERQGDDHWKEESRIERGVLFDTERAPMMRFVWLRSESVSEVLLVCHHCICDGMSVITVMRELLLLCEQPDLDIGKHTSMNGIEDIVPREALENRSLRRKAAFKAFLVKMLFAFKRIGRPVPQGPLYVINWKLNRDQVQALSRRSKSENVTAFAALSLAFSHAFRAVRGSKANGKFLSPVDVRKFLPLIKPDSLFAASPSVIIATDTRTPPDKVGDADFWEQARALKAAMNKKIDRMSANVYQYMVGFESLHSIFDRFVGDKLANVDGFDVTLSNLGRIDLKTDYGRFQLETLYSPTVWLPWRTTTAVVISGFNGEMDFHFISDEASLPYADAETIRDRAMALLLARSEVPVVAGPAFIAPTRRAA